MEHPSKMDDLGVPPFQETSVWFGENPLPRLPEGMGWLDGTNRVAIVSVPTSKQEVSRRFSLRCWKVTNDISGGFLKWGTPQSSILQGCSILSLPVWGTPSCGNPHRSVAHICP